MNSSIFGPDTEAEVKIDANGKVERIRIIHPNRKSHIDIPPDWAADISGNPQDIRTQVSDSLNGARVRIV